MNQINVCAVGLEACRITETLPIYNYLRIYTSERISESINKFVKLDLLELC